ncbi:21187_t:CDS:2 [Cetraspora pellucida]|uniref:21187_t:CDS:1 n=1 Tax=Cetraspora pellucida TaxID=1433469 RepID=A0A9N9A5Z4_9GLOM|nr:21187_t:CDS:2 [Cetraspora pellucida]
MNAQTQNTNREDWLLWQFTDSALPTGGFVASAGLESATQAGHVTNTESLLLFLSSSIDNYAYSSLPFVTDTWWAVDIGSPGNENLNDKEKDSVNNMEKIMEKIISLDNLYDACTSNYVTKRASKAQGVAMLTLFAKSFANEDSKPNMKDSVVEKFKLRVRKEISYGHLPICFGLVTKCLGISLERTQHLYLFLFARAILSAAVRLNIIGPYYSQRLLTECQVYVEKSLEKTCKLNSKVAVQTSPLLDILQGRHDKLYSSKDDTCRYFPSSEQNDCNERNFCEEWEAAAIGMILASVVGGLAWLHLVSVLLGGRARREKAWKILSVLFFVFGIRNFVVQIEL